MHPIPLQHHHMIAISNIIHPIHERLYLKTSTYNGDKPMMFAHHQVASVALCKRAQKHHFGVILLLARSQFRHACALVLKSVSDPLPWCREKKTLPTASES